MKRLIRRWLGLDDIESRIRIVASDTRNITNDLNTVAFKVDVHNAAIGRVIAKLEPMFVTPEDDPKRRKESFELGQKAIKRIIAEAMTSSHSEDKL